MSQLSASPATSINAQGIHTTENRLTGILLVLARGIWVALVLFALGLLAFNLPHVPHLLAEIPCSDAQCTTGLLGPDALHTLHNVGISVSAFAIFYMVIFVLIPLAVSVTVGLFLAWRRSYDWMALLVSLFLILFQASVAISGLVGNLNTNSTQSGPLWYVLFYYFCQSLAFPVFALFPNGRFAPRWTVWLVAVLVVGEFVGGIVPSNSPLGMALGVIGFPLELALIACLAGSMVYRYVRIATSLEQQQIKWLTFFLVLDIILNWIGPVVLSSLFPQFGPHELPGVLYNLVWPVTFLGIPISIAIAILRYRLWDIDRIINRTLVYGLLTGILAALYLGLVLGLQALFASIVGQASQSPIIIVGSTLIIATLFRPLRARIQAIIDRRFYRRKYDAERTLAAFSATLRNEVDLPTLSEQLVAVVQETMQPAHVSLWLRWPEQRKERQNIEEGEAR